MTFPLADILNLFLAELLVFSLGIIVRGYTRKDENLQPIIKLIKVELPLSFVFRQISDAIPPCQYLSCPL